MLDALRARTLGSRPKGSDGSVVYRERVSSGQLATVRGIKLNRDDEIRARVIEEIMCVGSVDWLAIGAQFAIDPVRYFAREQADLARFASTGIIASNAERLTVTPQGRLLLRAVAMVFDAYKNIKREQVITFSRIA